MATILEGTAQITIDGVPHTLNAGEAIIMPAGIPHAVQAVDSVQDVPGGREDPVLLTEKERTP